MADPTLEEIKQQVRNAVKSYASKSDTDIPTAMLSGMSLTANFLAKLDGSKTVTPALVLRAVTEVANERGVFSERLTPPDG